MSLPRRDTRLEVIAGDAIADIELIADNRKPHGCAQNQDLAVFDRVRAEIAGMSGVRRLYQHARWRASGSMRPALFYFVCWGT